MPLSFKEVGLRAEASVRCLTAVPYALGARATKQTSHRIQVWPLVEIQELIDNALDAAEEAETGRPSVCVGPTSTLEAFPVPAGMECLTIFGGLRLAATKRGGQ